MSLDEHYWLHRELVSPFDDKQRDFLQNHRKLKSIINSDKNSTARLFNIKIKNLGQKGSQLNLQDSSCLWGKQFLVTSIDFKLNKLGCFWSIWKVTSNKL